MGLTKDDLKAIGKIVREETTAIKKVVSDEVDGVVEVVGDLTKHMDKRFNKVEKDITSLAGGVSRIENKLDPTINKVDEHGVQIKKLKQRTA